MYYISFKYHEDYKAYYMQLDVLLATFPRGSKIDITVAVECFQNMTCIVI